MHPMMRDLQAEAKPVVLYIHPDNKEIFKHFMQVVTQVNFNAANFMTGLNYASVCSYLNMVVDNYQERIKIFEGIKVCEIAMINKFNTILTIKLRHK